MKPVVGEATTMSAAYKHSLSISALRLRHRSTKEHPRSNQNFLKAGGRSACTTIPFQACTKNELNSSRTLMFRVCEVHTLDSI